MNGLVSIIVPVYKTEKYLRKCIDSILKQDYQNIEIIIIDDGSPDNSGRICDEYEKKDNRIKVIHQKNTGLSGTRNLGIDVSKGDYMMFIDSDDYIDESMVSYLMERLTETDADIAMCDYYDVIDEKLFKNNYPVNEFIVNDNSKYDYLFNQYAVVTVIACNKLYRRYVFDNVRYPVGKTHEDEYVIAEILNNAKNVCYSLKPLYYYVRERTESIMNSFSVKKFDFEFAYNHRKEFFETLGLFQYADLTEYTSVLLMIKRIKEYINLNSEPDRNIVRSKLNYVDTEINKLLKSKYLNLKRRIKLWVYSIIPGLYRHEIDRWMKKKQ
ncbi:MAG: glycosyltransferase family 2 protein [Lachnospiraceae bacterium]|nr:glycosyltransferase family 2 protein [Erysipelotrichaceae bacterium]MBR4342425.1 glycosyltransferase family 2 protein [Lachnospiraceae bacterium]